MSHFILCYIVQCVIFWFNSTWFLLFTNIYNSWIRAKSITIFTLIVRILFNYYFCANFFFFLENPVWNIRFSTCVCTWKRYRTHIEYFVNVLLWFWYVIIWVSLLYTGCSAIREPQNTLYVSISCNLVWYLCRWKGRHIQRLLFGVSALHIEKYLRRIAGLSVYLHECERNWQRLLRLHKRHFLRGKFFFLLVFSCIH